MATRTLPPPRNPLSNIRLYDNGGNLLAALVIPEDTAARYITPGMLYRYCSWIFIVPQNSTWDIYHLGQDGITPGAKLRRDGHTKVSQGNYIVLDAVRGNVQVALTDMRAPRRVVTRTRSTGSERDPLQRNFRESLRERDQACVMSGLKKRPEREKPFSRLKAAHIFPISRVSEWERGNYQHFISDTSPAHEIGETKLYSPQNGLLLRTDIHEEFDDFSIGVDPDDDYRIICFQVDDLGLGGQRLAISGRCSTNEARHASPDLLKWHLMQCVYKNMKANAEPEEVWEEDLGSNDMGQILEQPDAGERMEVELLTRLGGLVA
ncbi:uncharacterized protein N7496_007479 [Penicillium cataractarum]|uniref:HNH nuclease domain-containing protein n=1 Tax=Penicillium cataractarum TaxID=2100454 RepID=A0A9W9S492_9EURO|nr:uncharacterized protein N7496_007479 [Penicillium cataractarum]KAJ5371387.1 hypothetical protein N7496_007479 [Penicillium cataractarum]